MPSQAQASTSSAKASPEAPTWRYTHKAMNVTDLSRDDDFLSHLLVEKLGNTGIPLHVHKMDLKRRLPKVSAIDLLDIVRRLVMAKGQHNQAIKAAVDSLLELPGVRYYIQDFDQQQINAFATHASRYFALYNPTGNIEIAHTQRYSHKTGKSELCVLATRSLAPGAELMDLTGSLADLTEDEDRELKGTDIRNSQGGVRRDFSVIHSRQMKKNHLFLGPARFVNHDCDNNCELFRLGKIISFRVIKPIAAGEEVTAHYGDDYFGRNNKHCLCETCEKAGAGGYRPRAVGEDSDADEPSDMEMPTRTGTPALSANVNVNERRTRRGVYAVVAAEEDNDADDDELPPEVIKREAEELQIPAALSSLSLAPPDAAATSLSTGLITPSPDPETPLARPPLTLSTAISLKAATDSASTSATSSRRPKFEPVISTRAQKRAAELAKQQAPITPPLSDDAATPMRTRSRSRVSTPTTSAGQPGNSSRASRSASIGAGLNTTTSRAASASLPRNAALARSLSRAGTRDDGRKGASKKGKEKETNEPTCATCACVLPVISIQGEIVWGDFDHRGRKKKEEHECPRCLRHFAIYQLRWPSRSGSSAVNHYAALQSAARSSTPVAVPSSSSSRYLKADDHKLPQKGVAASSKRSSTSRASSVCAPTAALQKRKAEEHLEGDAKRKHTDGDRAALVGRSRSGRTVVPSAKLLQSAEQPKRPRGRPPKLARAAVPPGAIPSKVQSSAISVPKRPPALSTPAQPAPQKTRAQRAQERAKVSDEQYLVKMASKRTEQRADMADAGSSPLSSAGEDEVERVKQTNAEAGPISVQLDDMPVPSPLSPPLNTPDPELDMAMQDEIVAEAMLDPEEEEPFGWEPPRHRAGGLMLRPTPALFAQMKWAEPEPEPEPEPGLELELGFAFEAESARVSLESSSRAETMMMLIPQTFDDDNMDEVEVLEVSTATSSGGPVTPEDHTSDSVIHVFDDDVDDARSESIIRPRGPAQPAESDSDIEVLDDYDEPAPAPMRLKTMSSLWRPSPTDLARRRWSKADSWRNSSIDDDGGSDVEVEVH